MLFIYIRPIRPTGGVTPIFLHLFTPHVGPLDLVTCKEAGPLYWCIRPTLVKYCYFMIYSVMKGKWFVQDRKRFYYSNYDDKA